LLLKERVCALVIKLFSPNVKHRQLPAPSNGNAPVPAEKPYFPISMRLLRLVAILIQKYHTILVTECEIFLSLIIKFLDPDKPAWQRALALEVIHKLVTRSSLIAFFCKSYDLKNHATNIVHDMIAAMGSYVRYSLINASAMLNGIQPVPLSVSWYRWYSSESIWRRIRFPVSSSSNNSQVARHPRGREVVRTCRPLPRMRFCCFRISFSW